MQFLKDFCGYSYPDAFEAAGRGKYTKSNSSYPYAGKKDITRYQNVALGKTGHIRPESSSVAKFTPRIHYPPTETWQLKAEMFVEKAHQALKNSPKILNYLKTRGIDSKALKSFMLGWFPGERGMNCMFRPRKSWGVSAIKNEKTGKDKKLWIPRGIVIPYIFQDSVLRIRIRRPKSDIEQPQNLKYYIVPGSSMEAMAFNLPSQFNVIVESELDAMMIFSKLGKLIPWVDSPGCFSAAEDPDNNTTVNSCSGQQQSSVFFSVKNTNIGVVSLGSAQNKPDSRTYYALKQSSTILIALDFDTAGQKAWEWWQYHFPASKLWPPPVGKDPGEALTAGIDIKEWIFAGLPPVVSLMQQQNKNATSGRLAHELNNTNCKVI